MNTNSDFDSWYSANYRRVLGAVLIVCAGDLPRAEDATNDAFIDALEKWSTVGAMESPRAWVTKVAINKAKRSWLRRRRYVAPVNIDNVTTGVVEDDSNVDLWAAVNRLSVKQRSAIVLRYVDDLTQSDIADALGGLAGDRLCHPHPGTRQAACRVRRRSGMTGEPTGDEIPELLGQLEGSLCAPDAAAIYAGLERRQTTRKRMLGGAGAFVAALAIGGGLVALTQDDTTSTVTADEVVDLANDDATDDFAVAEDSAPTDEGPILIPGLVSAGWSDPVERAIRITECANGARIEVDGSAWLPGLLPSAWGEQSPGQVTTIIREDILIAVDDDGSAAPFFRPLADTSTTMPCLGFGGRSDGELRDLTPVTLPIVAALGPAPVQDVGGTITIDWHENGEGLIGFSSQCRGGAGYEAQWGDHGFTVVDEAPQPSVGEGTGTRIRCAGPPPRVDLFSVGDDVTATVSPHLVVLDVVGETSWRLILDRPAAGQSSIVESPTATGFPPESTVPAETTTTTIAPPRTTTTPPAAPPAFAPSDDLAFSGLWTLAGMWDGDQPVDLAPYGDNRPSLGIVGRRAGGNDGCNSHGGGLFYATADGRLQLRGGTTTNMGCIDPIHDLYQQGALGADRWGRSVDGNLVLSNGTVTTEFVLTEALPLDTPHGLSAPLDTIWMSDVLHDYDNFDTANSPARLAFSVDADGSDRATLTIAGCGDITFRATFGTDVEGPITFTLLEEPNLPACEVAPEATLAFEALGRADYFAASFGGILLWDGPTPVAIFADE